MSPVIYLVVPCYNEEEVLPETTSRLLAKLAELERAGLAGPDSRIVFVNDGSKDRTWEMIQEFASRHPAVIGLTLSRNRGHQNAVLAGLMWAKDRCDAAISLDADLQDDVNAIDEMCQKFAAGVDIVYGVRSSRQRDSFFKRFTAEGFYRVMRWMGVETVFNHADFRLMSRRALAGLAMFDEVNLFLRGIIPMIGYRTDVVLFERQERFAGTSKYPLKAMLALAFQGITSTSVKPIRMISTLGFSVSVVSALILLYSVVRYALGETVVGWASLILSLWFLGGLVMLSIGVVGEYVGKIYLESKHRPRYIVAEVAGEVELPAPSGAEHRAEARVLAGTSPAAHPAAPRVTTTVPDPHLSPAEVSR